MNSKFFIYSVIGILVLLFSFFHTNKEQVTYKKESASIEHKKAEYKKALAIQKRMEEELVGEYNTEDTEDTEDTENYQNNEESFGLKDVGTPCESHKYMLKSDVMESLIFSIKDDHNREIGSLDISIGDNDLDEVVVFAESAEVISKTVEYPIWVINADDDFRDKASSEGRLSSYTNRVRVDFFDGGRGILIDRDGGGYENFGKNSEEELAAILNSQDLITEYKGSDETYSWQVERDYSERTVKILTASISVSTPTKANNLSMRKSFDIKIDGNDSISIFIEYNQFKKRYIIQGEGFDVNCQD